MLYNIGAYQSAKEEYETLYPELKNRGAFLFEYGYCLHKLKQYDSSTKVLKEGSIDSGKRDESGSKEIIETNKLINMMKYE